MVQHAVIAGIVLIAVGTGAAAYLLLNDDSGAPLASSSDEAPSPAYQVPPSGRTRGPTADDESGNGPAPVGLAAVGLVDANPASPAPARRAPLEPPSTQFNEVPGTSGSGDDDGASTTFPADVPQWYDSYVDTLEQTLPIPVPGTVKSLLDRYGPTLAPFIPSTEGVLPVCPVAGTCVPGATPGVPTADSILGIVYGLIPPNTLPVDPSNPAVPALPSVDPNNPAVPQVPGVPAVPQVPGVPDAGVPDVGPTVPDAGIVDSLVNQVTDTAGGV